MLSLKGKLRVNKTPIPNQEVDRVWSIVSFRTRWINKPKARSEEMYVGPNSKKIKTEFNEQKLLHITFE